MEPVQQLEAPLLFEEPEPSEKQAERELDGEKLKALQQDVEQPQPITETEEELPPDAQPLPQWSEIVSALPVATRSLLASTQAFLHNGSIFIQASPSARKILDKAERAEKLRESAKSVLGGRFRMFLLKEREEAGKEEDFVSPLLQKAKDMGIDITINDK